MPIHGQVIGDLTWTPRTLDATRQAAPRGKRFAPVTIQSSGAVSFDLSEASAGPIFDVVFQPATAKRAKYIVLLTLRDDAPSPAPSRFAQGRDAKTAAARGAHAPSLHLPNVRSAATASGEVNGEPLNGKEATRPLPLSHRRVRKRCPSTKLEAATWALCSAMLQ